MTMENAVSSDFLSTFVDCKECFRLPPTRSDVAVHHHTFNQNYMSLWSEIFSKMCALDKCNQNQHYKVYTSSNWSLITKIVWASAELFLVSIPPSGFSCAELNRRPSTRKGPLDHNQLQFTYITVYNKDLRQNGMYLYA